MREAELVLDAKAELAEGPVWDEREQRLYWVDIMQKKVHKLDPMTGTDEVISTDQYIGAIVPRENGGFVAAMHKGVYILDAEGNRVHTIAQPERHLNANRFNDGKCDPQGRFWAGTLAMDGTRQNSALYRIETNGTCEKVIDKVSISNGLAWSPDQTEFYYIDSLTKQVWAYSFEPETGRIHNQRVAVEIKEEDDGIPDGMTIDAEGMLWVAHWGGYKVSRFNPVTGERLAQIFVPAKQVTSCTFGGSNFDELYITTAREGLDETELAKYPLAGGIFRVKTSVKGCAVHRFAG